MFERSRVPSLDGVAGWLDSEPLGLAEMRGHVVLVNFRTLTCINWLRRIRTSGRGRRPTATNGWS